MKETFTTGTGQELHQVHPRSSCSAPFCVIHKPCPGPWADWPTHWCGDEPGSIWRGFERICPCGVGHPAVEEIMRGSSPGTHGCCGQCPCHPSQAQPIEADGKLLGYKAKGEGADPGDRSNWAQIIERYRPMLMELVEWRMAVHDALDDNDSEALDLAAERLWRRINTLRGEWQAFTLFLLDVLIATIPQEEEDQHGAAQRPDHPVG